MLQCLSTVLARKPEQIDWTAFTAQDWQQFVRTAHMHGVAPLLWYTLNDMGWPDAIPSQVRNALHMAFYQTTAQNTLLYQELERILDALQDIPVVVLKGAALANTLYPHIGTRPMADIDLLVSQQDFYSALQKLYALHYTPMIPHITVDTKRIYYRDIMLRGRGDSAPIIEIHSSLIGGTADKRTPSMDWFFHHTQCWTLVEIGNQTDRKQPSNNTCALQLVPIAHLLYIAAHMVLQHSPFKQARLLWVYDTHIILTHYAHSIDYDKLLYQARQFQWDGALCTALRSTHKMLGTSLPNEVSSILFETSVMQDVPLTEHVAMPLQKHTNVFWHEISHLNWIGKLFLIRAHLFPNPSYVKWYYNPYPTWIWPLCYPYRWWYLASVVLLTLLKKLRIWRSKVG